ncbi:GntR family transcriptional regulator [Microbacterium sp. E-13]|uniref:GntR family transcriptional regulator n=1 Tax=Microbacterium sp. E-13 TaxID=3404048 RepID=UPI003CF281CD
MDSEQGHSAAAPLEHPRAKGGHSRGRHQLSHRVRDLVRSAVLAGEYSSQDQLIEEVLMHTHGASRNAVRRALQQLLEEGVVRRAPRRGTFPDWGGARLHLVDVYPVEGADEVSGGAIDRRLVPSTPYLRDRLRTDDAQLRMVESTSILRGEVIGLRTAYFSSDFDVVQPADHPQANTLAEIIATIFSKDLGHVTTEISASIADAATARILHAPPGIPLLRREQLVHDSMGLPVEIVFDTFRADRTTFKLSDYSSGTWPAHIDYDERRT